MLAALRTLNFLISILSGFCRLDQSNNQLTRDEMATPELQTLNYINRYHIRNGPLQAWLNWYFGTTDIKVGVRL